jgi:hypothetical protein
MVTAAMSPNDRSGDAQGEIRIAFCFISAPSFVLGSSFGGALLVTLLSKDRPTDRHPLEAVVQDRSASSGQGCAVC